MDNKEINSCDNLVEMMGGADMLGVEKIDEAGVITVVPVNSKTGQSWSMALVTDVSEAVKSKYPKTFADDEVYRTFVTFANKLDLPTPPEGEGE